MIFLLQLFIIINSLIFTPSAFSAQGIEFAKNHTLPVSAQFHAQQVSPSLVNALIKLNLDKGWKTYWRSPGEGGLPLDIKWHHKQITTTILWPVPQHFITLDHIHIQGYTKHVNIAITLEGNMPEMLDGVLLLPICNTVCEFVEIPLQFDLKQPQDPLFEYDFQQAMASTPKKHGLITKAEIHYQPPSLLIYLTRHQTWEHPDLFLDSINNIVMSKPTLKIDGSLLTATVQLTADGIKTLPNLAGESLSMVVADMDMAQDITITVSPIPPSTNTFFQMIHTIIIALLGGFILNLMPCVLPVLAIKIASLLQHKTNYSQSSTQLRFLASSAGILTSFWILALFLTLLKITNHTLGWGIQFQNPYFIGLLVIITALFTANLFDTLHIYLPASLHNYLAKKGDNSMGGYFLQGMFATLLATPCSAPFLGTAVSTALIAPIPYLWLIFTFLGLGMSLPWLSLALFPKITCLLPKPGRWMNTLKITLGILMFISCGWLIHLLSNYIGALPAYTLLLMIIGWLSYRLYTKYSRLTFSFIIITLIIAGILPTTTQYVMKLNPFTNDRLYSINWQPLSEENVQRALAQNKRIFIDITADWCLTCKVNNTTVLQKSNIRQLLNQADVIALQGDWTKRNPEITKFLAKRSKFAIPFNQIYGPNMPNGQILSTILTSDEILSLMDKAKGQ